MGDNNLEKDQIVANIILGKSKEFGNLIGLDGTLELLIFIEKNPRRYSDIESFSELSHASILRRLNKLQMLNIIKKQPIRSNRRGTHQYELTIRGEIFMKIFRDFDQEIKLPISQQKILEVENNK
jgi:DNA-binding HxlR family transcriptional regulator